MRGQTRLLKRATLSVAAVLCVALPAGAADDLRLVEAAKQRDGQTLRRPVGGAERRRERSAA